MIFCKNKTCCGGLSPVKATDEMTQAVGQRHGQLFTEPSGADINPVEATEEMIQPVGVRDGKLYTDGLGGEAAKFQLRFEQFQLKDSIADYRNMRLTFDFRVYNPIESQWIVYHSISVTEDGMIYYDDVNVADTTGFYADELKDITIISPYVDTLTFLVLVNKADFKLIID